MFSWFKPPQFPDEAKTHQALVLHVILWILLILPVPYLLFAIAIGAENLPSILARSLVNEAINIFLMVWLRNGHVRQTSILQIIAFWLFVTVVAIMGEGVNGAGYLLGYELVIILAGVLLGGRGAALVTACSLLMGAVITIGQLHGGLTLSKVVSPLAAYIPSLIVFPISAFLQNTALRTISEALARARASEERYRLISTVSSDYMFSTRMMENGEFELLWVAGAFESITGYTLEEYKARGGWVSLVYPPDLSIDAYNLTVLLAKKPVISEIRTFHKNGELRWARVYAQPVWDNQKDRLVGVHGAVQDITERKQTEEALHKRDNILEAVAFAAEQFLKNPNLDENITTVLARLGSAMNVTHAYIFINHSGSAGEALSSMRYEWSAPGYPLELDDPEFQNVPANADGFEHAQDALRRGEPYIGIPGSFNPIEKEYFTRRGIKAIIDIPIFVNGSHWGTFGFDDAEKERDWSLSEIDALKIAANIISVAIGRACADDEIRQLNATLEQRVRERTSELEQANRELEAFSYSVSHDMRAPLRSVKGFSEILLREFDYQFNDLSRGYIEKISASATDMSRLIDGLLTISRLSRSKLKRTRVDLSHLANDALERLKSDEPGRSVALDVTEQLSANADFRLMQILLDNLLGNAWKFTSRCSHASITFGCQVTDGEKVFFVRDNGAGFDMSYRNKLFGPFQRLHHRDEFPGEGAGLAIAQRIVHKHGGRIWAEGEVDKGATFFFTLPG